MDNKPIPLDTIVQVLEIITVDFTNIVKLQAKQHTFH